MASTVRQATLLLLLTLQVGVQPLLMGWYASEARDVRLRVGVVELLKLLLALVPLSLSRGEAGLLAQLKGWRLRAALATTVLPALIYVLQNLLNHAAVVTLDGVTFNVLNQTKIIWTALLVYLLLGKRQSPLQMLALGMLCVAAVLMTSSSMEQGQEVKASDAAVFTGMYQALLAAVLSALAGSIIQRALQREKRNQYMITVELSVLGEATLVLLALVQGGLMPAPDSDSQDSMWEGWSKMTLVALFCQALGGVLVGFVIRDCGNVEKSFAVVGGMGLTALLETQFNGKPFGHNALIAMALVAISTALYTLNPPVQASKNEKTAVPMVPADVGISAAATTIYPESSIRHAKKKMSADTSELEPFLAPPAVVTVSSNRVHSSSSSRQEMRRSGWQTQPLHELPTTARTMEAIV
ncbi:hypothetical protein PHYBOEH_004243 [Phytophthora boehmeriae]|uniref:Drug/Metabolite transporter (DMT) Superfamily n=1 Tax=Phytophthora boehmeriae TaxID=109152 RepID=A0A8T1WPH1_9STRA|nr:hypothetical protein PHYBOEH_004243 [Phytophthora boehmeriae]